MEIGPLVKTRDDFKGFYHIWPWRPSWSCDQHHVNKFNFHVPKSLHIKIVKNGPVVSEKSTF